MDGGTLAVRGGSHGGYLTGHLLAAAPRMFRCGASRNPVTDIASMVGTTDIPDWCFAEAIGSMAMARDRIKTTAPSGEPG